MKKRDRMTVEGVKASRLEVTASRPYMFTKPGTIWVYCKRTLKDGVSFRLVLTFSILEGCTVDGASTKWPVSLLVPNWRKGDDRYNAAPTAHDLLYIEKGVVPGVTEGMRTLELSREECDDVIRGMWRCWGMSRFLAGCADKGVELFAGGKAHWGNDGYGTRGRFLVRWKPVLNDNDKGESEWKDS